MHSVSSQVDPSNEMGYNQVTLYHHSMPSLCHLCLVGYLYYFNEFIINLNTAFIQNPECPHLPAKMSSCQQLRPLRLVCLIKDGTCSRYVSCHTDFPATRGFRHHLLTLGIQIINPAASGRLMDSWLSW